ncbi:hypothetical protein GCM10020295_41720 [Streptomyces cinereospinus]
MGERDFHDGHGRAPGRHGDLRPHRGPAPPSRTADVRRHLDECELCADVYASLEEIRGVLGTLPGPARMPADIAGRIDAALAAEALLQATAPDAVSAPAPPRSGSRGQRRACFT